MKYMSTSERLLTIDDLLTGDVDERAELWDGALVLHDPSGGWHGIVEAGVAGSLREAKADGWVLGVSAGYVLARNPDRVLSPDASFITKARLPHPPTTGFIEGAPDLAVEIRSPHDSWTSVVEKGSIWIAHGVRVVWCIDSDPVTVAVLRPGLAPGVFGLGERFDARPVLDLELSVDDLFEGLV